MITFRPNLKRLEELRDEARQLRKEGRLSLEESRRIVEEARAVAGNLEFENWFEPLSVALPYEHIQAILQQDPSD